VGLTVNLVESPAGVPDQFTGLFHRFRAVGVHVGLIDDRLGGAVGTLAHRLDHLS
jgi:hypothetical protein